MANAFYTPFKTALGNELHSLNGVDTIVALLVDTADYTFSAAHDFLDDVVIGEVARATLASVTWAAAVLDSADFSWTTVTGDQSEAVVLANSSGAGAAADAARMLIAYYDTGMTGMPVTPSGGNINFTVHTSGWFSL